MTDNHYANLALSDEEQSLGNTARSAALTISSHVSPRSEGKFLNTQELLSPVSERGETNLTSEDVQTNLETSPDRVNVKV
jgi:hypothetical protein